MVMLLGEAVGIRFAIDEIESGGYGFECWKIFWRAIEAAGLTEEMGVVLFYEGDTAATLDGHENVFCIVVQCDDISLDRVTAALSASDEYQRVAATPPFVGKEALGMEPLPEAGRLSYGRLTNAMWAEAAWKEVHAESVAGEESRSALPAERGPTEEAAPAAQTPAPAEPALAPAAWYADPTGRHQYRYWDGTRWTEHVADRGMQGTDSLG